MPPHLGDELLGLIFSTDVLTFCTAARVCRKWRSITRLHNCGPSTVHIQFWHYARPAARFLLEHASTETTAVISECILLGDPDVSTLCNATLQFQHITTLVLVSAFFDSWDFLGILPCTLTELELRSLMCCKQ